MSDAPARIKVLIGANDLLLAGVQRLVIDQLQQLDRTKFEVHLIILRVFPGKETFRALVPEDVSVHQLQFRGLWDIVCWAQTVRLLLRIRPRVVKTATFFSNTVFLVLRPFFGYRVIAAEHNTVSGKPRWQRMVDRILLPQAYAVVADSKMVATFVTESEGISSRHFRVIYNGIDIAAVVEAQKTYAAARASIRAKFGIPQEAQVLFTAARLVQQKNHALMIEAFAKVCAVRDDAFLLIAGEGGLRGELEALVEARGISDRCLLLGAQKNVQQFYAISDIFLLTSRHEGFCIAAMEGLAFGLPLISTNVAGVGEYLSDGVNGFFTEHAAGDIAEKILRALNLSPGERALMATNAKETARHYSIERYGEAINALVAEAAI